MKPSEVVAAAAEAAVRAIRHPDNTRSDLSAKEWEAMYHAQCSATDDWAEQAETAKRAKGSAALNARIKELERALATVNERLSSANDSELALIMAARRAKDALDDCTHPDCLGDRERTGYSCCAGGHLARSVVKAILGTEHIPGMPEAHPH